MGGFFTDLRKSLGAWRLDARLPLLTAVLSSVAGLNNVSDKSWVFVVTLATWLFLLGFYGAQREWYRVIWEGGRWSLGDVLVATRSYFVPFFGLAIVFTLWSIPLWPLGIWFEGVWARVIPLALLDMLFTFAPPALVFTTRDPTRAFSYGWRMLKEHWRHGLPYIVFPPLILQALWSSPEIRLDLGPALAISVVGGLVGLLFKGATAAFYLRHGPPPEMTRPGSPAADDVSQAVGGDWAGIPTTRYGDRRRRGGTP